MNKLIKPRDMEQRHSAVALLVRTMTTWSLLLLLCSPGFAQQPVDTQDVIVVGYAACELQAKNSEQRKRQVFIDCLESLLELACDIQYENDSTLAYIHYRLAIRYNNIGGLEQSMFHTRAALYHSERHFGLNDINSVVFLNNRAQMEENYAYNLYDAILLREQILAIGRKAMDDPNTSTLSRFDLLENFVFLIGLYTKVGNHAAAKQLILEVERIRARYVYTLQEWFGYDLLLSHKLMALNQSEEALKLIDRQHHLHDSLSRQGVYVVNQLVFSKAVMAEVLLDRGETVLAEVYARDAVELVNRRLPEVIVYRSYVTFVWCKTLLAKKQYLAVQREVSTFIAELEAAQLAGFDDVRTLYLAELKELLARCLHEAYQVEGKEALLATALVAAREAQTHLYQSWGKLNNTQNLRFALIEYYKIIETSLHIYHTHYQKTGDKSYLLESLQLMDLSRNVQLRSSLRRDDIAAELGIPASLIDTEYTLNQKLWDLTYRQNQTQAPEEKQSLQDSILIIKENLAETHSAIFEIEPDFIRKTHHNKALTIAEIETYLRQSQQTVVAYAVGENHSFAIAMSEKGYRFAHYPIGRDSLQRSVDGIRSAVSLAPDAPTLTQRQTMGELGHQLYDMLLGFATPVLTDRLVVIADGPLEILPFSLLLSEATDAARTPFNAWPFAIRKFSLSYAYALDMLLYPPVSKKAAAKRGILAFAPSFDKQPTSEEIVFRALGSLTYNREEVAYIADRFACTTFADEAATSQRFRQYAPDYAVIHLATHATANVQLGDYSYLSFSTTTSGNDDLKIGDLYGMNLPAELVVLSACETGLGEWRRGEGVVGLERAFSYSGVQSLVSTHWKVSDLASSDLMALFYDQLATGVPKDIALQRAQLAFMDTHDAWLSHPFFWAGFVQKGSTAPLSLPRKQPYWLYFAGAVSLLAGAGWLLRRRKKN